MSILIRGAKMPKSCIECLSTLGLFSKTCPISDDSNIDVEFAKNHIYDGCPLVEVPPHGRLIDADKLDLTLRCMYKSDDNIEGIGYTDEEMALYNEAIGDVRNVMRGKPTVIESEEEE